ncbi:MAG: cob(I)yrinic acid a,c-diamide adenosyltransferase [Candidatus Omnitrophica bacterium]|nr:cob(I)yrinic acid a,c-diamide adenosyltransferase [Candidatus Omnitrophota bacterium]MCA9437007.1 cob(I)yrinic acid a,c-diamide adenosyltransferase [Candidatus Omnitrophota bacterium]
MSENYRITKVYTRSGDDGTTGLVGKGRVSKNHRRIQSYGTVDELNAALGLARAHLNQDASNLPSEKKDLALRELADLQNLLFTVGCDLATRIEDRWDGMPVTTMAHVEELERKIDEFNEEVPALKDFVLPTGTPTVAALHLARTICRRAERDALTLRDEEPIGEAVLPFLNRLSDYLFVLSRWLTISAGDTETTWEH